MSACAHNNVILATAGESDAYTVWQWCSLCGSVRGLLMRPACYKNGSRVPGGFEITAEMEWTAPSVESPPKPPFRFTAREELHP